MCLARFNFTYTSVPYGIVIWMMFYVLQNTMHWTRMMSIVCVFQYCTALKDEIPMLRCTLIHPQEARTLSGLCVEGHTVSKDAFHWPRSGLFDCEQKVSVVHGHVARIKDSERNHVVLTFASYLVTALLVASFDNC